MTRGTYTMKNLKISSLALILAVASGTALGSHAAMANLWSSGNAIAAGGSGGLGEVFNLTTGTEILSSLPTGTYIKSVAELNANTLLLGNDIGQVYELNQAGQVSLFATASSAIPVASIQVDTAGNVFITASTYDSSIGYWQSTTGEYSSSGALTKTIATPAISGWYNVYTAISPNEGTLYGVWTSSGVQALNLATQKVTVIPGVTSSMSIQGIAVEANGNLLVTSDNNYGYVYQINPVTGAVISEFVGTVPTAYGNLAINQAGTGFWAINNVGDANEYSLSNGGQMANYVEPVTLYGVAVIGATNAIAGAPEPASAALLVGMLGMLPLVKRRVMRG